MIFSQTKFAIGTIICMLIVGLVSSCDDENPTDLTTDSFDRKEMLQDWSDLIIIPAFEAYVSSLDVLQVENDKFQSDATTENFQNLRSAYINAYKSWQAVSIFDIGKAESISLRNFTNIFPTDTDEIEENISSQSYNLELPSNFDAQGFPALDFLLFGIAGNDTDIMNLLASNNYSQYLNDLVDRLHNLSIEVLDDWKNGYQTTFVNNSGASATASVDKMVNDFLFYYERFFRAGKIGIPAGHFSGSPIATSVEAPYSNIYSKELFFEAMKCVENFFIGNSFDGNSQGQSLQSYLAHISEQNKTVDVSSDILNQWTLAKEKANLMTDSFQDQVNSDNQKMLNTYDELQLATVMLKVDMMQALNIQIDYVDADGD